MRIVVFSDSHGNYYALERVMQVQRDAETFIYLGDGIRDFEKLEAKFPEKMMYAVCGNCDYSSQRRPFEVVTIYGKSILITHGHQSRVKESLFYLKERAVGYEVDIALFGHTHTPHIEYDGGIYFVNPGSVGEPRNGKPTYAVIDITDAGIVPIICEL